MAAMVAAIALPVQAQGIYVNLKNGERIKIPAAEFDKAVPSTSGATVKEYVKGAKAKLQYSKIADMQTPRIGHQLFPSGNGFVAVGGHTSNFELTTSAEIYENGAWRSLSVNAPHDGGFSVTMGDGRVMVGGGFSSAKGVGQSKTTEIYDPATQKFTPGPDMNIARACCVAANVGGKVYVSGNWYAEDPVMDCYNGSSFAPVGNMDNRSHPYLLSDRKGNTVLFSSADITGELTGFYMFDDSEEVYFCGDYTYAESGETEYIVLPFSEEALPVQLPDDMRPENYKINYEGNTCYLILTKTPTGNQMYMIDMEELETYVFESFEIPSVDDAGKTITWRGGVLVNEARKEAYLIGASGTIGNQTLHIISWNYEEGYWTIASATGFKHNVLVASWTLLADGNIACTGGGINDNYDAQPTAYIFTPPVAGLNTTSTISYDVTVYKTDGSSTTYIQDELESITTYEENFDERITQQIPQEYLEKMSAYMPIYSGSTPPNIEGAYKLSVQTLVYDAGGTYQPGKTFADYYLELSNQNTTRNTIDFESKEINNSGNTISHTNKAEMVMLGQGDNFTVFAIVEGYADNIWIKKATIISGTKTSEGIRNFYLGTLMLDKGDDPSNKIMKIGTYRIFKDSDGLADNVSWPASRRIQPVGSGAQGSNLSNCSK